VVNDKRATDFSRTARAEASAWIVRLHGPNRSPQLEAGFRRWLAACPENAREFERVTEVWDAGAVPAPGVPRMAHGFAQARSRRWSLAAVLALVIIGMGAWVANGLWRNQGYTTGVGEQRTVLLSDGSRVTLNSDSRVTVSYRRHGRGIRIDRGEAFFEVARDSSRPFRVHAGTRQIEALGTSFDVRRELQQLTVTLVEGKVAVSGLEQSAPSVILTPGQRLRVSSAGQAPEIDAPRIAMVTAWLRGEMLLASTPLANAVAEMNRYDQRRLVIDDPEIAAVRISGVYHTGDSELFAQMVARLYGFRIWHERDRIHLVAHGKTSATEN
jgi:transmembrane sensor